MSANCQAAVQFNSDSGASNDAKIMSEKGAQKGRPGQWRAPPCMHPVEVPLTDSCWWSTKLIPVEEILLNNESTAQEQSINDYMVWEHGMVVGCVAG